MKCFRVECSKDAADGFLFCGRNQCTDVVPVKIGDNTEIVVEFNSDNSGHYETLWNILSDEIELPEFAKELSAFRIALKEEANSPEHDITVSYIANAEIDARNANGPGALKYLSNIGKNEITIANNINATLVTRAIEACNERPFD